MVTECGSGYYQYDNFPSVPQNAKTFLREVSK